MRQISEQVKNNRDREEKEFNKKVLESVPPIYGDITLVEHRTDLPILQSLIARNLDTGKALWVDSGNSSSTYALSSIGGEKLLEKVEIGRAFTVFQHYQMICELEKYIESDTELLVFSNLTLLYDEGGANDYESRELFEELLDKIESIIEGQNLKVLIDLPSVDSELNLLVRKKAEKIVKVEQNSKGLRYSSDEFETSFYKDSSSVQTALPYWSQQEVKV